MRWRNVDGDRLAWGYVDYTGRQVGWGMRPSPAGHARHGHDGPTRFGTATFLQHRRVLVVGPLIGAGLVGVADAIGRTVIAPAQVPAGLITALVGTPYFAWLLWRSRAV